MDRKRQKLDTEKNDVQKEYQDAKITALERKLECMENKLKLNDFQKECQDEKVTALERKLEHMENKLKLNDVQKEYQDAKITALERKLECMENKLKLNDFQKECQDEKVTALERKLEHMENKLKLVIAELEQVKEEQARDKINFETEKCELEPKIDKYKEQCSELQSENEKLQRENDKHESENEKLQSENKRLQKYFQDLESANINVDEKSQINLYNIDLKSQITKVNESDDDALDINSLPNEIILNVFGYLEQNQLGQIARVCRRWNMLTKSPVLWKKVNVKLFPSHRYEYTVAESFINRLPSCVISIRLYFIKFRNQIEPLDFEELCLRLQEKCPHLEELKLTNTEISKSLSSVVDLCSQHLQDVKNLIFHHSKFLCMRSTDECFGISKIEILDLFNCNIYYSIKSPFSKMHHLKELHLFKTFVHDSWFENDVSFLNQLYVLNVGFTNIDHSAFPDIQNHGHNLKELYLCYCPLGNDHLTFTDSVFPHLKTICLANNLVTCEGVVSLIQSCPSLENVYVYEGVAESFAAHPFVVANRNKSGIVKPIDWIHDHNVNYSHN